MSTLRMLSILCFTLLSFTPLTATGAEKGFRDLLLAEYHLHPHSTVQDFYKFIHQSTMGSAHMGMDLKMAKEYLEEEAKDLVPDSTGPLFQPLLPDSSLVRLNLRPYLFRKGNIDSLANAFHLTSQQFIPSDRLLKARWKDFIELVTRKNIALKVEDADTYFNEMKRKNFPAVHHSNIYRESYRPSYRVILKKFFPSLPCHAYN